MATSSIRKEFTVKDSEAYEALVKAVEKSPTPIVKTEKPSELKRGDKLLKQFSFR